MITASRCVVSSPRSLDGFLPLGKFDRLQTMTDDQQHHVRRSRRGNSRRPGASDNRGDGERRGGVRRRDDPQGTEITHRPGQAPAEDEPETPELDEELVPLNLRAELKSLPKGLADTIAAHIIAAGQLIDVDPELAFRHAEAARRRAGRIPLVREAAAETAYAAGRYDIALREFRAIRRMNGGDDLIPVMADCERALGRYHDALELLSSLKKRQLSGDLATEALLVEAGTRGDMGQIQEQRRLLTNAIAHQVGSKTSQARLRYAYAETLVKAGQRLQAREMFVQAGKLDVDATLDVHERIAELDSEPAPGEMTIEQQTTAMEEEPSNE